MILLAVLAPLGIAMMSLCNTTALTAQNHAAIQGALFEAEGGLSYLVYVLKKIDVSESMSDAELLEAVSTHYSTELAGLSTMHGSVALASGTSVTIPTIRTNGGAKSFDALVTVPSEGTIRLLVNGHSGTIDRSVSLDFSLMGGTAAVFDHGIASKGPIRMLGNASVEGANSADEATCLAATYAVDQAMSLGGNCFIEGGIAVSNDSANVGVSGNVQVGDNYYHGSQTITKQTITEDPEAYSAIDIGVGEVEFPEVDPSVFESFATNVVTSSTPTSGNRTFTNIRIKANANKTFAGNVTLNGVIFIEQPNDIKFTGNVVITGVIVTEDAGDDTYESNKIKFTGNLSASGVEDLPNTEEFSVLRQMPGSFILAPGFGVEFTGNFGCINGTMAADKFKWTGNASGNVRGAIISYSDSEFKLTGNSRIIIDRLGTPDIPPGFACQVVITKVPESYIEH